MPLPSDMTCGTYLAAVVEGKFKGGVPISADALLEACDALGRATERFDPKSKTHARLTALYNIFFDFLCAVRHAEGPEPLTPPLRRDNA